jgi:hypothetical protein
MGTDLGVGTRTVLAMVAGENFSLSHNYHKHRKGPGLSTVWSFWQSTTVGGVSAATRRAGLMLSIVCQSGSCLELKHLSWRPLAARLSQGSQQRAALEAGDRQVGVIRSIPRSKNQVRVN